MSIWSDCNGNAQSLGMLAQSPIQVQTVGACIQFNGLEASLFVVFRHVFEDCKEVHFIPFSSLKDSSCWMAEDVGSGVVDDAHEFFSIVDFIPSSPFRHGVDTRYDVIELGENIIGMVKFASFKNIGFYAVEKAEINLIIGPLLVVLLDGGTLLQQIIGTRTVRNFQRGGMVCNAQPLPAHFAALYSQQMRGSLASYVLDGAPSIIKSIKVE